MELDGFLAGAPTYEEASAFYNSNSRVKPLSDLFKISKTLCNKYMDKVFKVFKFLFLIREFHTV